MSSAEITETMIKVPRWLGVALVVGAFSLGVAHYDARSSIDRLEAEMSAAREDGKLVPLLVERQARMAQRMDYSEVRARELESDVRQALGVVQLNVARICAKVGAECE